VHRAIIPTLALTAALIGSVAPGARPVGAVQDATPAAEECPAGSPEENKALVTQFYDIVGGSGGDLATVLAEEHVYHFPSGDQAAEPGHEDTGEFVADRNEDFPDVTMTVDRLVAEGDMVAAYLTWSGTHEDDDEDTGAPETGMPAEWVSAAFFRIECGKIVETWSVSDELGRLQDLGIITEEELETAEAMATPAA
jgi:predicted ester cyclase